MFPILVIVVGIAVLIFGRRLAVLGAAVGALLGLGLLKVFPGIDTNWVQWALVGGLAILGAVGGGFAKGFVDVIVLVIGALAGAGIVLGILDLFNLDPGLLKWVLVVLGAAAGLVLIRRARRGSQDWGIIILASLVGALLVTRGLSLLVPSLDGLLRTIIVIAFAAGGIVLQGGLLGKKTATPPAANA
jgi:hypothetical protein